MPTQVSVSEAVAGWLRQKGIYDRAVRVGNDIERSGPRAAAGVRAIKGKVYDWKCPAPVSDYRLVGELDGNNFAFVSVYKHGRNGGKTKVIGKVVSDYASYQS